MKVIQHKKAIVIASLLLFAFCWAKGQTLDDINQYLQTKDYERARQGIDQYTKDAPQDPKGWWYRTKVYTAICTDASARYLVVNGCLEALTSIEKAEAADSNYLARVLKEDSFRLLKMLYKNQIDEGISRYNAAGASGGESQYAAALEYFRNAWPVNTLIHKYGGGAPETDTNNLYYLSVAAINAKKEDLALISAHRVADRTLSKTPLGKSFEPVYQWLVYDFYQRQDSANFTRYNDLAAHIFPKSTYFDALYIDWLRPQKRYSELYNRYNLLLPKDEKNWRYRLAFAKDLYAWLFSSKQVIKDRNRIERVFLLNCDQLMANSKAMTDTRLVLARYYYNKMVDSRQSGSKQLATYNRLCRQHLDKLLENGNSATEAQRQEARDLKAGVMRIMDQLKK